MLCYDTLSTMLLSYIKCLLCYVMLCYVMLCYVMLFYVMSCYEKARIDIPDPNSLKRYP